MQASVPPVGQEVRRNSVRPALAHDLALLHDPEEAADRGAEDDPDPVRVEAVQPGVVDRFLPRPDREEHVPVQPARLFG
jgi:hypothetical protein